MTLARDLMARVWDKAHPADGDMPATRPPEASDAPSRPEPTPTPHPPHPEPAQARTEPPRIVRRGRLTEDGPMEGTADRPLPASSTAFVSQAPALDIGSDGPTDTPPKRTHARWHADEAGALAKLAELTKDRSPWAAAHDMTWRP